MTPEEIEKVLGLIGEHTNLALAPIDTAMGFKVGFEVVYTGEDRKDSLLMFIEDQLPKGYDFNRLSKTFMDGDNRRRLVEAGLPEPENIRILYGY